MAEMICGQCGDSLRYVGSPFNRWIHLRLPIAKAWTHEARPVEPGSADSPGASGARVPSRPFPPTLSGAAAADLTFREEEPPPDAIGRTA